MSRRARNEDGCRRWIALAWGPLGILILAGICSTFDTPTCLAQEPEREGAGAILSDKARAEDVGLPLYPGSKPHKEKSNDSPAARMGLWAGGSGFKLTVMKMEASDPPDKVAAFYKKALAKYGKVLDCSNAAPAPSGAEKKSSSTALSCDDDKPDEGGMVFKSGTKQKQHIVAIQPNGQGSLYELVAIANWGKDEEKEHGVN